MREKTEMSSRLPWLLKAGVGCGLLLLLFAWVDWEAGLRVVAQVNPLFLLLFGVLFLLALVVAACRWMELLRPFGIALSLAESVKIYWIGIYLSNFLPSNIGGDVSRVGLLRHFNKTAQVAGSVLVERIFGFFALLLFVAGASIARPEIFIWHGGVVVFWVGLCLFALTVVIGLACSKRLAQRLLEMNGEGVMTAFLKKIGKLLVAIETYRNAGIAARVIGWSVLYYLVGLLAHYVVAMSLGFKIDFVSILSVAPLIWLISMLPVSVNAIGLAEGAFVVCYPQVGLSRPEALAFALLLRFAQMLCSSVGGLLLIAGNKKIGREISP